MGGLTTFSTFSYETVILIEGGKFVFAALNIILNLFLSLIGLSIGKFLI
ncbi:CrcB family protein [Terrisporobacter mayombei]|nr:CrcB family protein [Terrisporobacter mayombei]